MCNTFAASSNKSQCTDGDRSHNDEQGDDDDRDEDDLAGGGVDHPDEGGGSKLCEIGWNEQGKDSSYFSTQFRICPDLEKFIGEI